MYDNLIYSLKVVPKHDLQQQQANEHIVLPAQQTASVAIVKHIGKTLIFILNNIRHI